MNDDVMNLIEKAKHGDRGAQDKLVRDNSGLVWSVTRKFSNRGYDIEDLYQIGCIGILKAIRKFDTSFCVKFSTYAVPMIMGEIKRFLRDDGMIKVSRSLKETAVKANYAKERLRAKLLREPKISEIAEYINVSIEDLLMALEANSSCESLYKTIYENDKSEIYLIDRVKKDDNGEDDIIDILSLKEVIKTLPERDRKIILLRYYRGKTQTEIAHLLGISQVQVSRLEKKILANLKEKIG